MGASVSQTKIDELQSKLELTTKALRRSDELATAGRLALEVMHDIRNPLEALRNLNYLTSLRANDPETVRGYARLAEEQIAIVTGIANSTLDFAKLRIVPSPSISFRWQKPRSAFISAPLRIRKFIS
jgi:signal transduction histidine kinase